MGYTETQPWAFVVSAAIALLSGTGIALAEAPAKEPIRIGQTMPYSGPLSALGAVGKAELAFFQMINDNGGLNGRRIELHSLDDAFSPPKTFEQTRRLVEQDDVLAIFGSLGTATNSAIQRYLNGKKVPHLFLASGATKWADPEKFPWTMPGMVTYEAEGAIYARYVLKAKPDARIAILSQNDDFGRDYVTGFKRALGEGNRGMIVAEKTYELSAPTINSELAALKASGANTFFAVTLGKFGAQAIRGAAEMSWKPQLFLVPYSSTGLAILEPAGLENAKGLVSASYQKNVDDPQWMNDGDVRDYLAFMRKYLPDADARNTNYGFGYMQGNLMLEVLKRCGDDLTRENVLKQATSLRKLTMPLLLPGIALDTGTNDYQPFQQLQMQRFDGTKWSMFGEIINDPE